MPGLTGAIQIPAGPVTRADVIFTNGIGVNAATEFPNAAAALAMDRWSAGTATKRFG